MSQAEPPAARSSDAGDGSGVDAVGGWPTVLGRLLDREALTAAEAGAALTTVLAGEATDAQIAAFIVALRVKGEGVGEVAGMVDAMLAAAAPLRLPSGTIDIVGTGGSPRRRTRALNVSTIACLVAAGAGATVCKHGNVRASSTSGSMDLLSSLGIAFDLDGEALAAQVEEVGIGFCFARAYHPAMRHAGPVRAQLGVPTVFNVLGPLSHPGRVGRQVLGVGDDRLVDLVAGACAARGAERTWVVHGEGSLDELAITGPTEVVEVRHGSIVERFTVTPDMVGLARAEPDEVPGGTPEDNAAIARSVLAGDAGPARDIVVLNAAAGLVVADLVEDLAAGVAAAGAAIDDGRAQSVFDRLVARSAD